MAASWRWPAAAWKAAGNSSGACQAEVAFKPAPRPFGGYEELLASPGVDAVYLPLPAGVRSEWVKRAIRGKHVVCEKPCATSVAESLPSKCLI